MPLIELSKIDLPEHDLRDYVDIEAVEELANSLRIEGQLQQISVFEKPDGRYEVIYGARRTRAARFLNWVHIDAAVSHQPDASTVHAKKLAENIHRENLTPIEEAKGLADMLDDDHQTLADLRRRTGKSMAWIKSRLELIQLPDDIQELVQNGSLTIGVARILGKIEHDETRAHFIGYAVENGCTEDQAKRWMGLADAVTTGFMSADQSIEEMEELRKINPVLTPQFGCFHCRDQYDVNEVSNVIVCRACLGAITDHREREMQRLYRESQQKHYTPRLPDGR